MISFRLIFGLFYYCCANVKCQYFTDYNFESNYIQNVSIIDEIAYTQCNEELPPPPSSLQFRVNYPDRIQIPVYYVDLNLPPDERWQEVATDKKFEINQLMNVLRENAEILFGNEIFGSIDNYQPYLTKLLPKEYYNELIGISTATELTVGEIVLYNIFYEFYSFCTSIVMQDIYGCMHHGRNLDFGFLIDWDIYNKTWLAQDVLQPLVIKVEFQKDGKSIYSSINFAGHIGIFTAVKKNKFSLSINERFKLTGGPTDMTEWILERKNKKWLGVLTREVMEKAQDFKDAQKMLALPKLVVPCYFIIAGNKSNQGCVITRGPGESEIWNMDVGGELTDWHLIQTNYDHWKKQPQFDDRRTPATVCMEKFGQHYPIYTLYNVLSTIPILNKLTIYTAIMNVIEGQLDVWVRTCPDPCWPSR